MLAIMQDKLLTGSLATAAEQRRAAFVLDFNNRVSAILFALVSTAAGEYIGSKFGLSGESNE
ncbi:MAG: hypothetical protein WBA42_24185 [Mesorhizobium sp.]